MLRPLLTFWYLVLFATLSSGCADFTSKQGRSIMAPEPSFPSFSLSEDDRADLRPGFDEEALRRFMTRIPPENRAFVLSIFKRDSRVLSFQFNDNPELNELLWAVYAPLRPGVPMPRAPDLPSEWRRVDLVLVPRLLQDPQVGAMVIRDGPGGWERIVVPEAHATPAQLFQTHNALLGDQLDHGMFPASERRFIVKRNVVPGDPNDPRVQGTLQMLERNWGKAIQDLRRAPFQEVPGFGRARVLVLFPGSPAQP